MDCPADNLPLDPCTRNKNGRLPKSPGLTECCKDIKRDHLKQRKQHWIKTQQDHDMFEVIANTKGQIPGWNGPDKPRPEPPTAAEPGPGPAKSVCATKPQWMSANNYGAPKPRFQKPPEVDDGLDPHRALINYHCLLDRKAFQHKGPWPWTHQIPISTLAATSVQMDEKITTFKRNKDVCPE